LQGRSHAELTRRCRNKAKWLYDNEATPHLRIEIKAPPEQTKRRSPAGMLGAVCDTSPDRWIDHAEAPRFESGIHQLANLIWNFCTQAE
jgi:hypothetical protein